MNLTTRMDILAMVGLLIFTPCFGAKILLHPININSHFVYISRLAEALSEEGHVTTLLLPSNAKPPKSLSSDVEVIKYAVPAEVPPRCSALFVQAALADTLSEMMDAFSKLEIDMAAAFVEGCDAALQNDKLMEQLSEKAYDIVVVDSVMFTCGYTLPYKLGVPYVSFSVPYLMWMMRVPALPSFVPSLTLDYTDHMSFLQRLSNIFLHLFDYSCMNNTDHFTRKYVPEKPTLTPRELLQKSSLFLALSDKTVSYPSPTMPNIKEIGDIMARPAQPLPDDLKRYMDVSKRGVILISFGSYIDHLPSEITCKIAEALSRLEYNAIWRVKEEMLKCDVASNVKVMPWIPQNDLLGHTNMKLFISHCGLNSVIEAVYHAVPVLAFPLCIDQPYNAKVVETHGYGLKLDLKRFTVDDLVDSVNTIITDTKYKDNISKASNILRDVPQSASKRASFWINHVVKYGDDHLRTKAVELTDIEFFMLDIFAVVSSIIVVLMIVCICCCRLIYKFCCSKVCGKGTSKAKQE